MPKLTNKSPTEFRPPDIKLGYALLLIVLSSSPNCSNTFVVRSLFVHQQKVNAIS